MARGGRRPGAGAKKGAPRRKPISGAPARDFRPLALRARDHTAKALEALVGTLDDPAATPAAKVSAAIALLDRGWGKPTERHEHVNLNAVAELSDDETPSLSCEQRRLLLTALEQAARARAIRRSLTEWSRHCGFEPALHHRLLIRKLEQVASGVVSSSSSDSDTAIGTSASARQVSGVASE
jgi:hypothetical protein